MFLEGVPTDLLSPLLRGVCVVVGGEVGDNDGLPWAGALMYRHRCQRCLREYVDGVDGGCCYGVSLRWCDGGISLDGEEEVVAVRWPCPGGGGFRDRVEADGLEPRCECAVVDRPFPWQVPKPFAVRGGAVLWGELHCGDGVGEGLCAGAFLCGWWGRCLGHLVVRLL